MLDVPIPSTKPAQSKKSQAIANARMARPAAECETLDDGCLSFS
jgi:hypothetical protein